MAPYLTHIHPSEGVGDGEGINMKTNRAIWLALLAAASSVQAGGDYTLTVPQTPVRPGETIQVCWTAPTAGNFDWIGLFLVGADNQVYLTYQFVNGQTSGCKDFTAPNHAGQYDFRYLPNNGYVATAVSDPVTVLCNTDSHCADVNACTIDKCVDDECFIFTMDPSDIELTASPDPAPRRGIVQVCWSMPIHTNSSGDWVSLSIPGSPDSAYVTWAYTDGAVSGCVNVAAPDTTGDFEPRFHAQRQDCVVGRGSLLTVCDPVADETCPCFRDIECNDNNLCSADTCVANSCVNAHPPYEEFQIASCRTEAPPGFPLTVCWTAPPNRPTDDWVAYYDAGVDPHSYRGWTWASPVLHNCWTITAPQTEGPIDFRYLLDNGYCAVATSPPVEICADCSPATPQSVGGFSDCLEGPAVPNNPTCADLDLNCDGRIDLRDAALFQRFFNPGPP